MIDDLNLILDLEENLPQTRKKKWPNTRIDWQQHLQRERHNGTFSDKYHMEEESFNKLVELLRPKITVDAKQSMRSTSGNSPITPEIIVATGLRFLGRELSKSLEDIMGIDKASVKRVIELFLDAVENTEALDIKLPSSPAEMETLSEGFEVGQIRWHGADRAKFLERIVVGDIAGLADGHGLLSLVTNEKGGIIDDTVITNAGDHIYMVINGGKCLHTSLFLSPLLQSGAISLRT